MSDVYDMMTLWGPLWEGFMGAQRRDVGGARLQLVEEGWGMSAFFGALWLFDLFR